MGGLPLLPLQRRREARLRPLLCLLCSRLCHMCIRPRRHHQGNFLSLNPLALLTPPRAYPPLFASTATMSSATLPFALSLPSWHLLWPWTPLYEPKSVSKYQDNPTSSGMSSTSASPSRTASSGSNVASWPSWPYSFSALSSACVPFYTLTVILSHHDCVQIHFIFALSRFYANLASGHSCDPLCADDDDNDVAPLERIFLLPHPSVDQNDKCAAGNVASMQSPIYAPVPLAQVSPQIAHQLRTTATEAWVSRVPLRHHAIARVPYYDVGNEHSQSVTRSSPSVGPIHLKNERS